MEKNWTARMHAGEGGDPLNSIQKRGKWGVPKNHSLHCKQSFLKRLAKKGGEGGLQGGGLPKDAGVNLHHFETLSKINASHSQLHRSKAKGGKEA